jgi:hypothetical protein
MNIDFSDLAPTTAARIETLSQVPLIKYVNETVWIFAIVETAHLLFLTILGGAVLALNLRLLDVALRDVPPREVERATRPWLIAGVIGTILTGVAMGLTTANTLLPSAAFFVKMVALVAAILFSVAIGREVRRSEGAATPAAGRALALVALLLWGGALALFATTRGLSSGAVLVALAGFALLAAFVVRHRRAYLIGLGAILGGGYSVTEWISADGLKGPAWLSLAPLGGALALVAVIAVAERRDGMRVAPQPARAAALASTLAWITVAAAGRWIGFS